MEQDQLKTKMNRKRRTYNEEDNAATAIATHSDQDHIAKSLLGSLAQNRTIDYHIAQVIQIITSNVDLVKYLEKITEEVEEPVRNLIECTIHLKRLLHEKLMISSKVQMENDKRLRVAYKSNVIISKDIRRLQEQMNKQNRDLGIELGKKNTILASYEEKIEKLKIDFEEVMNKVVQKSEKQMMNDSCNSEVLQSVLEQEAHATETQYSNLLEANLAAESHLRQKRNKVEAQLASWLTKYDNDVGEKQTELEKLQNEYEEMTSKFDVLMEKFNEQSVEYDILMEEKEAEERQRYEQMAFEFLNNRSARIIQKSWRGHKQRKLERRRARKAKGKGKDKKKTKKHVLKVEKPTVDRKTDANTVLQKAFKKKDHIFEEIDTEKEFPTAPVEVDLAT